MAAFFAGVVKAPVTGMILILEMSGNLNHLSNLVLVSLSAFVSAELIGSRPVYAVLLERLLKPKTPALR
jgi:H+/Cl- antiporter ClcA